MCKEKIIKFYETGYSSSPQLIDEDKISVIMKNDYECNYCNTSIFKLNDFPIIRGDEVVCEECFYEAFCEVCPLCENSFEAPTSPKEHRIVVGEEVEKEKGIQAGIYQVKKYPFQIFCFESVELVKPIHMNALFKRLGYDSEEVGVASICNCCFKKYTGQTYIKNNYVNRRYGMHKVITEKGLIQKGVNLF